MQTQSSCPLLTQDYAGRVFGMAIGNLFLGGFGMLWIVIGLVVSGRKDPWMFAVLACFLLAIVAISIQTMRRTHGHLDRSEANREPKKKMNRQLGLVNCLQWGLIFLAVYGLEYLKLDNWILPAIIFIVGAHFVPLARLFEIRTYYYTGAAMVAWAILDPFLFIAGKDDWIGGVGTGAILWITALCICWQMFHLSRPMSRSAPRSAVPPQEAAARDLNTELPHTDMRTFKCVQG
ncbi:MAG: hypothetical protein ACYCOR_12600 [Acidobacteriaceae bacterium]